MRTIRGLILCGGLLAAGTDLTLAQDTPAAAGQRARAESTAVQEAEPAVAPPAAPAPARVPAKRAAKAPAAAAPGKAMDRLELDPTQITGNRELPKVMVIVPWKRSDIGELAGRPLNSLVDEALQPVDREVFRREIDYFSALAPDRPHPETHVTGGAPSAQPEK